MSKLRKSLKDLYSHYSVPDLHEAERNLVGFLELLIIIDNQQSDENYRGSNHPS